MENLIAKKYAKAILERKDSKEFYELLSQLSPAFALPKFKMILESSEYKKGQKLEIIMSFFQSVKPSFENFIRLLTQNSRLTLIPKIVEELRKQEALKAQIYTGIVYSEQALEQNKINDLEKKLSEKFKVSIKLENQITKTQGIKISLEELGYEISFSIQSLQTKMSDYILKTL
ncbi:ATP F0F1 synthase subunit delta [Campylobacter sp. MIT 12-8780]|uniref:F0F1 ATP synthase subunit delta n=1 Tax=unclassified Campylobacter TaxID=2593542 RepID=UPI0010F6AF8E|nr:MULTISPECIES: F0F1 ATP synthase subunit delta [unclassified Campylobacter]NDJ27379.1 F0F1 ATP synthase subunit delta [Campylobacter sp. MIT 19-121]TKX28504.1 ATP F0F1 synthase subunit delta [Campylobacter sp. MIT 12-5580]TQR40230.1 ATP F0F1 synthase subunit delta [Campylobacter sp. MIT 12-8780]